MTEEHSFLYRYEANIPVDSPGERRVILVLPTGMLKRIKYDNIEL